MAFPQGQAPGASGDSGGLLPDRRSAARWVAQRQDLGQQVVVTNGCFDLLHVGHIRYLAAARALGDALLVGLNSDLSPSCHKGPGRPLIPQQERAETLTALRSVDAVVVFDELTAEALLAALRPALYAKGADYASVQTEEGTAPLIDEKRLPEARIVQAYGGKVILLPYHGGHSTTSLIARMTGASSK